MGAGVNVGVVEKDVNMGLMGVVGGRLVWVLVDVSRWM